MRDVPIEELERSERNRRRLWDAIYGSMVDHPRFIDPDFIQQKSGFGPKDNEIRRRRAWRILQKVHPMGVETERIMERDSDDIYKRERRCSECGLRYELLPADDGRCAVCIAGH